MASDTYNHEAEQYVLASFLKYPNDYFSINSVGLNDADFVDSSHRKVMRAILEVVSDKQEPNLPDIVEQMKRAKAGGEAIEYATRLTTIPCSSSQGADYAKTVKGLSVSRGLARVGVRIIDLAQENRTDYESAIAEAERGLREFTSSLPANEHSPLVKDILTRLRSEKAGDAVPVTFSPTLQSMTNGLHRGHVWVIGGFSSTGKSAFACNMALDALEIPGKHVAIISAEMTQQQYLIRLLSIASGIPQQQIASRVTIGLGAQQELSKAAERLSESNLYVYDNLYRMTQIRTELTRLKSQRGLDVVILDYIQNVSVTGDEISDAREVALECQRLAKDLDCAVIAFSQLSNAQAKYDMEGGDENFYSLKGHGAIRDVADVILTLHRDRAGQSSALKVKFRKNRHGPMSDFTCKMDLVTGRIEEMQFEGDDYE